MVENQERMLLYKTIGLIEILVVAQKITGCTHLFLFCGWGEDKDCPGGGKSSLCNVAHAIRTLHNRIPIRTSCTMVAQLI